MSLSELSVENLISFCAGIPLPSAGERDAGAFQDLIDGFDVMGRR